MKVCCCVCGACERRTIDTGVTINVSAYVGDTESLITAIKDAGLRRRGTEGN